MKYKSERGGTLSAAGAATAGYTLNTSQAYRPKVPFLKAVRSLAPLFGEERGLLVVAFGALICSSAAALFAPLLIGRTIDTDIRLGNSQGLVSSSLLVLMVYLLGVIASYTQIRTMGGIGRRVLWRLRNKLFAKLQELPVAFFNQSKAGDLISRINNDTDKLNQFVSQALMQFVGGLFMMAGAAVFVISLSVRLGIAALLPALGVLVITRTASGWVRRKNMQSLQTLGGMSSEIQESLNNFRVIVAFHRPDYFRRKFEAANERNFRASIKAGFANNLYMPLYTLASNVGQLVVLCYGIYLIETGHLTVGLLVGFLLYANNFYGPLRQLAAVWSSFQLAVAALDRISEVLSLESNLPVISAPRIECDALLAFRNVHFEYSPGKEVLHGVSFELERGKKYALVGPTGGGKTTTASIMARLYDPTTGLVIFDGRDIRSYTPEERTRKIGFILQDPFLFSGTVRDNILYGNALHANISNEELLEVLERNNLSKLLMRFPEGLDTRVASTGNSLSLGQKQIIAFMRAALLNPELLILDEATANIDTVTEQILQEILDRLPPTTTRVIIAHRLNTIDNVDQIFFINSGQVIPAGSMEHAIDMLLHGHRAS